MSGATDGGQPLLQVEGLSVVFGDDGADDAVHAVDGVSWALRSGKVTALVGESGSGKTVSAMAVLGLLPLTARVRGSVRLTTTEELAEPGEPDTAELVGAEAKAFRSLRGRVVSLVSQEPMGAWNPVQTIGTQVAEALQAHRGRAGGVRAPGRLSRGDAHERVVALLRDVGLDDPERIAASYPHQLSGGQLQRALVAMALSQDPVAVVADEPTTALDVTVQAGVLDLLRRLRDERRTAVLLITHDMGVVADLADDVVVMQSGKVVEHASVEEVFARPAHAYTRALLDAVPHLPPVEVSETAPLLSSHEPVTGHAARSVNESAAGYPATPAAGQPSAAGVVVLDQVGVVYGGRRGASGVVAADGVDLSIQAGEVLGLVGESGSGKSTLSQVVAGLLRPTSGRVLVDGVDLAQASRAEAAERRRRTGIVFQDPASTLNPRWSVGRSIAEPLFLHTSLDAAGRRARVLELLDLVRLRSDHATRFPHELSGGQRQRVAIARAVALEPRVLVADEPTSALDVSVQAHVLDVLRDLQERIGFACLFVSHDLAVVERIAQRVAVMRKGRIVERGATAQVLRSPRHAYTRRLVASAPVADPGLQAERRSRRAAAALGSVPWV